MLLLSGIVCAQNMNVVASIQPLYLLAREILPEEIEVQRLLPAGVTPHGFQMSVSHRRVIEDADLVVWVGPAMEPFLTAVLKSKPQLQLSHLPAIHWPKPRSGEAIDGHSHANDPHLWLNPDNGRIIARQLITQLSQDLPAMAHRLQQSLAQFEDSIDQLEGQWRHRLANYQAVPWLLYHDAAGHFETFFQLAPYEIVARSPEVRPGAKYLHQLRKRVIPGQCLLVEQYYPTKQAQRLAQEFDLNVTAYDPLGADATSYTELIDKLVEQVHRCLSQSRPAAASIAQ